jgi:integrase
VKGTRGRTQGRRRAASASPRRGGRAIRCGVLAGSIWDCGVPSVLSFRDIQQRDGRWAIVDLKGKHGRIRTVPMPGWAQVAVETWRQSLARREGKSGLIDAPGGGRIARAVNKAGNVASQTLTPRAVFQRVRDYGNTIGVTIGPHDLRRTFGKLAHKGNAALEQIQLSLGHASLVTTERYLGVRQNLNDAPCDHLGLDVETDG